MLAQLWKSGPSGPRKGFTHCAVPQGRSKNSCCHPERSEGPMYFVCTTKPFSPVPETSLDFVSVFPGHHTTTSSANCLAAAETGISKLSHDRCKYWCKNLSGNCGTVSCFNPRSWRALQKRRQ